MNEMYKLERACAAAYEAYDFAQVVRRLTEFANATLSNLYLDVGKDSLYLDGVNDERRRTMVAVLDRILQTVTAIMAPITPFLSEEIFHFRNGASSDPAEPVRGALSVFSAGWHEVDEAWNDPQVESDATRLLQLRDAALIMIEEARQVSHVKTSFEVELDLVVKQGSAPLGFTLSAFASELTELFNVAKVNVIKQDDQGYVPADLLNTRDHDDAVTLHLRRSSGHKCPRCRTLRKRAEVDKLCSRCQGVIDGLSL